MKGCRPLSPEEQKRIFPLLGPRDRALFILGIATGFRISELLSIKIKDVYDGKQIFDRVYVKRGYIKKKVAGRCVKLNKKAKKAIEELLGYYREKGTLDLNYPLFQSQKGKGQKPITRQQASNIFKMLKEKAGLQGKLNTHSLRKTYADRMYRILNRDLFKLQRALGHMNVNSTVSYLSFREDEIDEAVDRIFE